MASQEWGEEAKVLDYLEKAADFPHRDEGEGVLLDHVPRGARRVLDLGTGDGRMLRLLAADRPELTGIGLDISPVMLKIARDRMAGEEQFEIREWDLDDPLPGSELGHFDVVVSSFAIHHLTDERKCAIYREAFELLEPGGVFANLEHVASASERTHRAFFEALGESIENDDPSDKLVDAFTQVEWLREIGFEDADCYWKWLEIGLLLGIKPEV